MGVKVADLFAELGLKVDEAQFAKASKRLRTMGKAVSNVGKKMTTRLTLPILALGAAGAVVFTKFQDGMAKVDTLLGSSGENIEKMGEAVLDIGRRTPVAVDELTSALFDLRSGGVSAGQAMTVLEKSAKLGVAGMGTTAEAANLVVGALNAFNLKGEEAERVYDLIFKTTKNGITTIAGLSQGFGAVAAQVADSGTELDEYLASVSALTTTTVKSSQAHTMMKAVFSGLTRETSLSRKVFKQLGAKDYKDLIKKSGGLVNALVRIKGAVKGDSGQMLKLLGSTEALNAAIGLTGLQNRKFTETLDDMRNGVNSVNPAFDKMSKTVKSQTQLAKNALTSLGVSVGKILAPALIKMAKAIASAADWFVNLDDSTKEWIVNIALAVAAIGPALFVIGKLTSVLGFLSAAVTLVSGAMAGLGITTIAAFLPIILIIAAIAAVAALLIIFWDPISEFFTQLWNDIVMVFRDAKRLILGFVKDITDAVDTVIRSGSDMFKVLNTGKIDRGATAGSGVTTLDGERRFKSKLTAEELARAQAQKNQQLTAPTLTPPSDIQRLVPSPVQVSAPQLNAEINVNVGEGADTDAISTGVRDAMDQFWDSKMRNAKAATGQ